VYTKVGFAISASGHDVNDSKGSHSSSSSSSSSSDSSDQKALYVVTPEEVGATVLKHLLQLTADFLGHNQVRRTSFEIQRL
jgi:hypothetical protein